jgi:hypothetical protein
VLGAAADAGSAREFEFEAHAVEETSRTTAQRLRRRAPDGVPEVDVISILLPGAFDGQ